MSCADWYGRFLYGRGTSAEALWSELDSYNTSVERYLRELCGIAEANKAGYTDVLNACAARKASMVRSDLSCNQEQLHEPFHNTRRSGMK